MYIEQQRAAIMGVYPSIGWKYKCKHMPDYQVVAIYHRSQKDGKFDKPEVIKAKPRSEYRQMTLFDYYGKELYGS